MLVAPVVALVLSLLTVLLPSVAQAARPGPAGAGIALDRDANYSRFDVATDAAGTAYVGWISSHPGDDLLSQVHVCVLPQGATGCAGGVQTTDALDRVTAEQLFVVAGADGATLVWHHLAGDSLTGDPMQDRIAAAQVVGGVLRPGVDVAQAPTSSTLAAVSSGPRGIAAAVVSGPDDEARTVFYYDTVASAPVTVPAPYSVGDVQLADDGTSTVMVVSEYAAVGSPVRAAWKPSGSGTWSAFAPVSGTTTDHGTARLATSGRGIRLLATAPDRKRGGDQSVIAAWDPKRHRFGKPVPALPGQTCATGGRDVSTDASGRVSSVAIGCDRLALGNHQTGGVGARTEFEAGLTSIDTDAQIATLPSGRGWVVWLATERSTLVARPIVLPALTREVTRRTAAGRLRSTVPVSCVPAVDVPVRSRAVATRGWRASRAVVTLDGRVVRRAVVDASRLAPGSRHVLRAQTVLARGGERRALRTTTPFRVCPAP